MKLKTPNGETLSYKQMQPDRNYMPHNIDWDAKIEDPLTKEVATLKEIMGKTFSQAKRERMLQQIASEMNVTPAEAADYPKSDEANATNLRQYPACPYDRLPNLQAGPAGR